jgi:CBS domain-containing protein
MHAINGFRQPRPESVMGAEELGRVTVPTVFLWGTDDPYLAPGDARPWIEKMPAATLHEIPAATRPGSTTWQAPSRSSPGTWRRRASPRPRPGRRIRRPSAGPLAITRPQPVTTAAGGHPLVRAADGREGLNPLVGMCFGRVVGGRWSGMTTTIRSLMTADIVSVDESATLREVATLMRDKNIGDVIVRRDDEVCGIVTDRDLVVRAVAEGDDPTMAKAGDVCTGRLVTLPADESVDDAARKMAESAIRRLPVVDGDDVVGIISLGALARDQYPRSVLGQLSAEPPSD